MSRYHISHIESCFKEYIASSYALASLELNWDHQSRIQHEAEPVTLVDVRKAARFMDSTYTIRIFATFEALLKEHMDQFHPQVRQPKDARAAQLIDQVGIRLSPKVGRELREAVHEVRSHRNALVHSNLPTENLTITDCIARLSKFLAKLPEPRR